MLNNLNKKHLNHLKKIRVRLPARYADTLSESTGLSRRTIYAVMNGERNNQTVVEAAQLLADEYQKKREEKIREAVSK